MNQWVLGHHCTHRLNLARRASREWCDKLVDTARQTQDSKFKPWRYDRAHYLSATEAPHNTECSQVSGEITFCFFET